MSSMRLLVLLISLINCCYSTNDLFFQIQPQSVRINNQDEMYITSDDHHIEQVLYRYDQIELGCECQTQLNHMKSNIYWTINNKIFHQYNNSNSLRIIINKNTVQSPITYIKCYCIFLKSNLTKIKIDFQYQLYIDFKSEPSLKAVNYSVESSILKQHFYSFIHHHFIVILAFIFLFIGITCPLIILNFASPL